MKNVFLIGLIVGVGLMSCGGNSGNDDGALQTNDTLPLNFEDMQALSLVNYGIDMQVMLPQVQSATGNSIEPKVEHDEGDYLWYLSIGPRFNLIIEDYGRETKKVAAEKKRLKDLTGIFDIEYLLEEPNVIMYKRTLHEGKGGSPSYHCYGETVIDVYTYVLRSDEDGTYKLIVEDMVRTIKSAAPVNIDA
jgi:hypothetical protein